MSEALSVMKKFNPAALLLLVAVLVIGSRILASSMPLEQKILPFIFSIIFLYALLGFEVRRVDRQEALEQEAMRRKLFGG